MHYSQGVTCFQAKIGEANTPSLLLFMRLGYVEASRSCVFRVCSLTSCYKLLASAACVQ